MGAVLAEPALVRICDLAGRPRGTGFVADELGTVITSHEAVDGLGRVVINTRDEQSHLAETGDITPLPEWDLALIRTEGLEVPPLVIGAERAAVEGTPVRLRTGQRSPLGAETWTDARLFRTASVTYTSTDRFHALEDVLELELPEAAAVELRLSSRASGSPVLDAATGAVLGVLGTALHTPGRAAGFAVPLRAAGLWEPEGPLGAVLARNGATVAGFGPDLNLAGALRLTAATARPAVERVRAARRVHRPEVAEDLRRFMGSGASAVALVGRPGSGRTTELAALAARRADDVAPAPTVWLRGADLCAGDGGVREAVGRALAKAARQAGPADAAAAGPGAASGGEEGCEGAPSADVVARLARDAKRPLLVLLDAPEEMPAGLARELRRWTAGTVSWLRASGARMAIACGVEHWEQTGEFHPAAMLHEGAAETGCPEGTTLPPCLWIGDLRAGQATRARERYGLDEGALTEPDAGHPLAMRMLAEIRGALKTADCPSAAPGRSEIFTAYLDLVALRIGGRVAAELGRSAREGAVRRLAVRAAGALHEAARRCLGPGQGAVERADFEEVFPRRAGWRAAVLDEGVLEEAGDRFRFADEEFADWLQGRHLEVDAALTALVHERTAQGAESDSSARSGGPPVPRHRIGPVVQALLLCDRLEGPAVLERRLLPLVDACFDESRPESLWWAARLLRETLSRVPDARPYGSVLRRLADRIASDGRNAAFGAGFWRLLRVPTAAKTELLQLMLPADPVHRGEGGHDGRFLDVVDALATAEPETVLPLLCGWFTDRRALSGGAPADGVPQPTVASAAQALLYAHRGRAPRLLLDVLIDTCHPRADELLGELAQDEPAALCRAVERWAYDERSLRRIAAAEYGTRLARRARTSVDREHLGSAARALLRRPGDLSLHAAAAALLLRVSDDGDRHLDAALELLGATGARELSDALTRALRERPEPVLAAFRARLCEPGSGAHHLVDVLARVTEAELAVATADLVREYAELRPERAGAALTVFVRRRLAPGTEDRAGLQLLTDSILCSPCAPLRAGLVRALGESGPGPLRDELLDVLLLGERDMTVLEAALASVVRGGEADADRGGPHRATDGDHGTNGVYGGREEGPEQRPTGELVRRIGMLMARTPEGSASFDRRLVELSREVPGFAGLLRSWAESAPGAWAAVVGPGARGMCGALADGA